MKRALLVSPDKNQFKELEPMLTRKNLKIEYFETGSQVIAFISNEPGQDLLITASNLPDMQAKPLIEKVIPLSPFTSCVVADQMDHQIFHDTYEGYGVLMQLPPVPKAEDGQTLEAHLDKIATLSAR